MQNWQKIIYNRTRYCGPLLKSKSDTKTTARKISVNGVFSAKRFPTFGVNTEFYRQRNAKIGLSTKAYEQENVNSVFRTITWKHRQGKHPY